MGPDRKVLVVRKIDTLTPKAIETTKILNLKNVGFI